MDAVLPDDMRPVRTALGHTALMSGAASPVFVPATPFIVEEGAMSAGKAPEDGVYTLNGGRFFIKAGDPLPPDAEFEKTAAEEAAPAEDAAPAAETAAEPEKAAAPVDAKAPGPSETTVAAGPTETAEAKPEKAAKDK